MNAKTGSFVRDSVRAARRAVRGEGLTPEEKAEYERRVGAVRRLLDTFERRYPYTDNVAQRIVQWAERGFAGEP